MCSFLARNEGICAGGSSGLNVHAALKVAAASETPATVVTVMPDLGVKYLSKVYNPHWLETNGIIPPATVRTPCDSTIEDARRSDAALKLLYILY